MFVTGASGWGSQPGAGSSIIPLWNCNIVISVVNECELCEDCQGSLAAIWSVHVNMNARRMRCEVGVLYMCVGVYL